MELTPISRNVLESSELSHSVRQEYFLHLKDVAEENPGNIDALVEAMDEIAVEQFLVSCADEVHQWHLEGKISQRALHRLIDELADTLEGERTRDWHDLYEGRVDQWLKYRASYLVQDDRKQREREQRQATIRAKGKKPCSRCGGDGRFKQFRHVEGGKCFRCGGGGVEPRS